MLTSPGMAGVMRSQRGSARSLMFYSPNALMFRTVSGSSGEVDVVIFGTWC